MPREGGYDKVDTLIHNNGAEPINNRIVNVSSMLEYYGKGLTMISG